eukprot:TRINITY_DN81041_c0_g1_i1.p1 TRINITY_DN81041_c0_g1~~TRINITY_DN81041_c0_g1_i1.p1  ORF type:complete len:158 (-),score=5.08 TRINITY_DN81041_c0_g1_i1:72-479(-)
METSISPTIHGGALAIDRRQKLGKGLNRNGNSCSPIRGKIPFRFNDFWKLKSQKIKQKCNPATDLRMNSPIHNSHRQELILGNSSISFLQYIPYKSRKKLWQSWVTMYWIYYFMDMFTFKVSMLWIRFFYGYIHF